QNRRKMPEDRVGGHVNRKQAGRICPEPEERCLTQGDDAGVAEREIERQREQDPDQHLRAEAEVPAGHEVKDDDDRPRQRVPHESERAASTGQCANARGRRRGGGPVVIECRHQPAALDGIKPCGRQSRSTKTAAYNRYGAACVTKYFPSVSMIPSAIAATNEPLKLPSPPTMTTTRNSTTYLSA